MQQYGHLLQNFVKNDHHVNNCVFTMMHHVAGDCLNPDALLQVNILRTFIEIWDREFTITRVSSRTVELQWLEHLWNHENMFETGVVRANEC